MQLGTFVSIIDIFIYSVWPKLLLKLIQFGTLGAQTSAIRSLSSFKSQGLVSFYSEPWNLLPSNAFPYPQSFKSRINQLVLISFFTFVVLWILRLSRLVVTHFITAPLQKCKTEKFDLEICFVAYFLGYLLNNLQRKYNWKDRQRMKMSYFVLSYIGCKL